MAKTLFVAPPSDAGGIGKYTDTLSKAVANQSIDVKRLDLKEGAGFSQHVRTAIRAGRTSSDTIHIQFEYGFFTPKLLFAWVFFPTLFVLSRLRDVPVVITMHEAWLPSIVDPPLASVRQAYLCLTHRLLAATSDQLLFLSDNAADSFKKSVPSVSAKTLPHGVDVNGTRNIKSSEAKREFGINPAATVVSQIGYVAPRKNTEVMLELAQTFPKYEFLVAGGPRRDDELEYFESIRRRAPSNLTVTGVLSDDKFHAAFKATDLAVLSYSDIRQSGILNWCFAYRLPMLCRRIPYFERIASEWGGIALYGEDDNLEAKFKTAVAELDALEREMDAFRNANSFEVVADKHVQLYQNL
jgi:glycosyltransferase involved in cell wall biosynthesis